MRFDAFGLPSWPAADLMLFWGGRAWGFDANEHRPVDDAAAVECPTLLLNADADPRVPMSQARRILDAIPAQTELSIFPSTVHAPAARHAPLAWSRALTIFLDGQR